MKPPALLNECGKHIDRLGPTLPQALANLAEWAGIGYGSGGDSGRSSDVSDPTFATAAQALERKARGQARDNFAHDHAEICEGLTTAEAALKRVLAIVDRSRALPTDAEGKPVIEAAPGCEPCSMVKAAGRPHEASWQQKYATIERPKNPGGLRMLVCSFHHEFFERYECLPTPTIDLYHLEHLGGKIPKDMIRDQMPEAFSLAQSRQRGRLLGRANLGLKEATA